MKPANRSEANCGKLWPAQEVKRLRKEEYTLAKFALLALLPLAYSHAEAYTFTPTDLEWQSWPAQCKAKYAWTNIGRSSKFAATVGPAENAALKPWEDAGIRGLHHYCTGMLWLNRAKMESDPTERKHMLRMAREETTFTLERSPQTSPYFAPIAIQMASIMHEQGESGEALKLLQTVISAQPTNDVAYSAAAVMQRELGHLKEAKQTLVKGYEAVEGRSAEINYNLGLVCIELGELDEAVKYAEAAYDMGFPLQGLRSKLQKLGRM